MLHRFRAAAAIVLAAVAILASAVPARAVVATDSSGRGAIGRVASHATGITAGTYTTTQTGSAISVASYSECAVLTSITAASGTSPTWATTVDESLDGGTTWILGIATGANLTAAGTQLVSIGVGASTNVSFGDTIRVRAVIGGTTPSFTGQVVLICK